jgi:hypothetical protein
LVQEGCVPRYLSQQDAHSSPADTSRSPTAKHRQPYRTAHNRSADIARLEIFQHGHHLPNPSPENGLDTYSPSTCHPAEIDHPTRMVFQQVRRVLQTPIRLQLVIAFLPISQMRSRLRRQLGQPENPPDHSDRFSALQGDASSRRGRTSTTDNSRSAGRHDWAERKTTEPATNFSGGASGKSSAFGVRSATVT